MLRVSWVLAKQPDCDAMSTVSNLGNIACTLAAVIATASAGAVKVLDKIDHPRYAFNYAVSDPITKDNKAQWETRDGDVVKGSYSLVEPDGTLRVVDYAATDLTGFNAVVKKIGSAAHAPIVTKPVAPLTSIIGPVSYGFGGAPLLANLPKLTSFGKWSLPWDPLTHSYGGWVPIAGPLLNTPYVTIYSKKYVDGKVHKWTTGPIPLYGKTLVLKTKH
ncbi:cuticle protein 7-like [Helicoverpa armigera]|uniref:cuticle protein 7-like n=1 Tax=Helicoverpa armigera TaxID=29058 RepID=UPI003082B85F